MPSTPDEVYRKFRIQTNFQSETFEMFSAALDHLWKYAETKRFRLVDWLGFEQFTRDVLSSPHLDDHQRCDLLRDAVGAFTGRGTVEPPIAAINVVGNHASDCPVWVNESCTCATAKEVK